MLASRRVNSLDIPEAAQWLLEAAENELHQGRLEEGLQDLETLVALARMEREEYRNAVPMNRVYVAGLGLATTWDALQAPDWTEPQLERLQQAWAPVDLVEAAEKGFLGARAYAHEWFAVARRSTGAQTGRSFRAELSGGSRFPEAPFRYVLMDYLYLPAYKLTSIDADELFDLTSMQESLVALRSVKAQRSWPEAKLALVKAGARIGTLGSSPVKLRYFVSVTCHPNFTNFGERAVKCETERQMMLAVVA
jgi:hypothetical protein